MKHLNIFAILRKRRDDGKNPTQSEVKAMMDSEKDNSRNVYNLFEQANSLVDHAFDYKGQMLCLEDADKEGVVFHYDQLPAEIQRVIDGNNGGVRLGTVNEIGIHLPYEDHMWVISFDTRTARKYWIG